MPSKPNLAVAAATVGGLLAVGGATFAFADTSTSPSNSSSASTSASSSAGSQQHTQDKVVTGTVADAVKAAVKAKDTSVTISTVQQDPDGSYDALGTKSDGTTVFYDVSKDYKTVTLNTNAGGARGSKGNLGTEVTGTTLASVKAAVTAKYSGVTVNDVRQDSDGSYHVSATTSDGTRVFYEVSKDLKTITERTAPAAGARGQHGGSASGTSSSAPSASASGSASSAPSSSATPGA